LKTLKQFLSRSSASKNEEKELLPCVDALTACLESDEISFNDSLKKLLIWHGREAMKGEYMRNNDGLMCLPGLALVKFAARLEIETTVSSHYLPIQLLEL